MDGRPTWTDCDEAGDYVVPNVLSPRDLVFRPDNMDETVLHTISTHAIHVQKIGKDTFRFRLSASEIILSVYFFIQ